MFSPNIVATDMFLDMPASTQLLYFHLGMHADDDGFVGPKKVMRMVGAGQDDLAILVAKNYVIPFESGVVVITNWKTNNLIRKDWYRPSTHIKEKMQLKWSESGTYRVVNENVPNSLT
jgi:hypothetical protein